MLSFLIFRHTPGWVKILGLAALVALLVIPPMIMNKSTMPPDLEKSLKDEDKRKKYG